MLVTIEEKEREMLGVLQALGPGWHTRVELAERMGKKYLNPVEIAALDLLTSKGQIEQSTMATRRRHILRAIYRVKE